MMSTLGLVLALCLTADTAPASSIPTLLAHLDSPYPVKREDATRDLIEVGYPAMPALRRARAGNPGPETRQRLDRIIAAIEQQDPPRTALHRLAERLHSVSDDQLVEGLYILALSRPASAEERAEAVRQLSRGRQSAIDTLIVRLRETKEGDRTFLDVQLQMLAMKRRMRTSDPLPLTGLDDLAKLVGPKLAAVTREMTDDQELASVFLVTLQRYPTVQERRTMFRYRQGEPDRQRFVADLVWSMMHGGEFMER
jgi:hypothetical protein